MSVGTFIEELRRLGVKLKVQGAGLTYDGPEEAVTPELVARMTTFKGEIIAVLASGEPDTATERAAPGATSLAPQEPCYWCRGRRFWRARSGLVICSSCHPPANPALVEEEYETPDARGLGDRTVGPFSLCDWCGAGTFITFTGVPICPMCAERPGAAKVAAYRREMVRCAALLESTGAADTVRRSHVENELNRLMDELGEPVARALRERWDYAVPKTTPPGSTDEDTAA